MSKSAISSIDKKNFYKLKPDRKTISDTISRQTNNNQNLRDIIMDYIIKNLFKQSHKGSPNKSQKGANPYRNKLKKLPIVMEVQINNLKRKIQVDGHSVLQKYIEFEQKNVYKQNNIEPLVVEILNFFDEMQEIADNTCFEVDQDVDLSSHIINIMLEKYHKDRQRANRIKQLDIVKNKTIAKYTRVSYLDIQNHLQKKQCQIYVQKAVDSNHNSHRVSRDTIYSSTVTQKDTVQTKDLKNSKSRLKDLVDKYKVFQHPEKIQQLRKQKLSQAYDSAQIEKITQSVLRQNSSCNNDSNKALQPSKQYGQNQSCIEFLQNWISQITISQKLYKSKIQQRQAKYKQTDIKVGKIIEQSQDEDEKQNQQENADNINQQHA